MPHKHKEALYRNLVYNSILQFFEFIVHLGAYSRDYLWSTQKTHVRSLIAVDMLTSYTTVEPWIPVSRGGP
jgi:hypothetical protein